MGIPSPIHAPTASPLLKCQAAHLKQLSPELPLLEAVEEVGNSSQACDELLPLAAMDLKTSGGRLHAVKSTRTWADANSDASDSGDEQDGENSTDLPRDSESLESRSNSSVSKTHAEAMPPSPNPRTTSPSKLGADDLQAKGVIKAELSALVPSFDVSANVVLAQLLCRLCQDGNGGMNIVPCMGDDLAADCEHEVFWCYVEPRQDGTILITPCTDAAACGVAVDASGSPLDAIAEIPGAPERPPQGSHAPMWVYGAKWPYSVAPTTLMLSNLPDDLLQEDLVEVLDKEGFSGFYDFLYLPSDPDFGRNLGYAIVNLTRHEYGLALSASMHGRTSWCGSVTPECQVTWSSTLQGISQLIEYYRNHPACHDNVPVEMRPTFFSGGWPRPFPPLEY